MDDDESERLPAPEARTPTQTQWNGQRCDENNEDANDHQRLGERGTLHGRLLLSPTRSPDPPAAAATAGSAGRRPWRVGGCGGGRRGHPGSSQWGAGTGPLAPTPNSEGNT